MTFFFHFFITKEQVEEEKMQIHSTSDFLSNNPKLFVRLSLDLRKIKSIFEVINFSEKFVKKIFMERTANLITQKHF